MLGDRIGSYGYWRNFVGINRRDSLRNTWRCFWMRHGPGKSRRRKREGERLFREEMRLQRLADAEQTER